MAILILLILIFLVAGPFGLVAAGGAFAWLFNDMLHQWWFWGLIALTVLSGFAKTMKA